MESIYLSIYLSVYLSIYLSISAASAASDVPPPPPPPPRHALPTVHAAANVTGPVFSRAGVVLCGADRCCACRTEARSRSRHDHPQPIIPQVKWNRRFPPLSLAWRHDLLPAAHLAQQGCCKDRKTLLHVLMLPIYHSRAAAGRYCTGLQGARMHDGL